MSDPVAKFARFYARHKRMPSYSEVCELMHFSSKNAAFRLVQKMVEEGVLAKSLKGRLVPGTDFPDGTDDSVSLGKERRMEFGSFGDAALSTVSRTPPQGLRILGEVQAGFPSPAEENLLDMISLDQFLVRNPQASFLLRVTGDSMIDEGIRPGDHVIIERGRTPKNGDVVLAQIDGDWTLKYFERRGGKIRLVPGNKKYPVLEPKQELKVTGVVASVVRKYF